MAVEHFGAVLVEGGLRGGVVCQEVGQGIEVVEEVRVGEVAGFEVGEEGGETGGGGEGEEGGAVLGGGEEVEEGGEEEAGGFFLRREAEELGVEGEDFLFPGKSKGSFKCAEAEKRNGSYRSSPVPTRDPSNESCHMTRRTW